MANADKEIRELRRLLRDLVALATTPAVWVGRDRAQIAESVADVVLHTLRADAVYVCLQSQNRIEVVRSPQHPGFGDEVRRLWPQSATVGLNVDTITESAWPSALRVAMQPMGISGDDGFVVVGRAAADFPNEAEAVLLSVAANQAAVALQAARLRMQAESERHRLQSLLAKAPAAIGLLAGPEHRWVYVNENYVRVTGRTDASHFIGKTLRESLPEIEAQPFLELMDKVYRTATPYVGREMKAKLNRAPGGQPEEAYFDFVYHPVLNDERVVDGIFVHAVEVTDKVTARQELEKHERQFREMIDVLPAAIYTTDAEGRLTHFNPAAVKFSGREPELGTDKWCVTWKLFYPDGRPMPHDECPMAIALKEGRVIVGAEAIAEKPDGTRRWFTPYPTPLRDNQGRIVGGMNMLVDITERKEAERATSRLAAIVDSSDDAIMSKKLDGTITSWNKSAERLFGYSAQEAIGQRITIIIPWERRAEEEDILRRLARGERIDHFETVRRRKDGSTLDVSLTISPIRDSTGRVIGASKIARDISDRKRADRALRQSERRLAAEADALANLNEWSGRLWRSRTFTDGLQELLGGVIELMGADKGNVQLLDPQRAVLTIVAQRGFRQDFLDFFREVSVNDESACGRALRSGEPVIIEDVERDPQYAPLRAIARAADYRAVVSAPLIGADGILLGMVSTHFGSVHRPSEQDLRRLDLYVRQAADFIRRCRTEETLRQSQERFRALVNATSYVVYRMSPDWSEMRQLDGKGFISDTDKSRKDWLQEYIHADDQPLVLKAIRDAIDTKSVFQLEHRVKRADGSLGWTYSRAVPVVGENGELVEWFGAASDVTARKEAEENYIKLAETLDAQVRLRTKELEDRNADVLRQSEQLRELSWQLLQTQDEERRHIARELHDSAGQTLAVLGMNLSMLVDEAKQKAPALGRSAEEINELVQQLTKEIRTMSYLLHPPLLDENGLPAAISWYVSGLGDRSGLDVSLQISEEFGRLPRGMELVIFRVVQECITNIHRHSGSKNADIRIVREPERVLIEAKDYGKGIPSEKLAEIRTKGSGVGIRGMRERLRQFNGEMMISSTPGGTTILVTIPISTDRPGVMGAAAQSLTSS